MKEVRVDPWSMVGAFLSSVCGLVRSLGGCWCELMQEF